jgi:tetratricopeptide (TPR) repeat protein
MRVIQTWMACAIAVVSMGATDVPAQEKKDGVAVKVRPSKQARAATKKADAIRARSKGVKGDARKTILREAAAAYLKVMEDFAAEPVGAAPASFAAAEIYRAGGDLGKAKGLYQKSIDLDGTRYRERSTLHLAHIARRTKDIPGAIALYQKVAALKPDSGRAHQARLWIARCHANGGKHDAAVVAFRTAVDKAATPRQVIDGCNRLASLLVKMGRLDDAEQIISRAAAAVESSQKATGKMAERLKISLSKAYANMSSRRALQRARDKANGAHKDAREVERRRSR